MGLVTKPKLYSNKERQKIIIMYFKGHGIYILLFYITVKLV